MEEKGRAFHRTRTMFAIKGGTLYVHREQTEMSHSEWFEALGWTEECVLDDVLRGYVDKEGIYFYRGENFEASELDAKIFIRHLLKLDDFIGLDGNLHVYAGVIRGNVGEKFKPCRFIGTAYQLASSGRFGWEKSPESL